MVGLLFIALFQSGSASLLEMPSAADWNCATPLIQKNYAQAVDSRQLALRIVDECARPFRPIDPANAEATYEAARRQAYSYSLQTFTSEVELSILKARRSEAIRLRR